MKYMPTNAQLLQYVATGVPYEEKFDIREISIALLSEALPSLLDEDREDDVCLTALARELASDCPYRVLLESGIDIEPEMLHIDNLATEMIASIDKGMNGVFTFEGMWNENKSHAFSEIYRAIGHGTSFWWHHGYEDFGFEDMPNIDDFDSPYSQVEAILAKFVDYIQQQLA
jgi:hypothetical protein